MIFNNNNNLNFKVKYFISIFWYILSAFAGLYFLNSIISFNYLIIENFFLKYQTGLFIGILLALFLAFIMAIIPNVITKK